jgi:hypothetical protein
MSDDEVTAPRATGEAAWREQRDAVERNNVAAKNRARQRSAASSALVDRERRLAAQEEIQLRALNARLDKRA